MALPEIESGMNFKMEEVQRFLKAQLAELEMQFLEKEDTFLACIELLEKRLDSLEDKSVWNILYEEAEKGKIPPEKLMREALTFYLKHKKSVK
jgi:hypothetical protein